MPSIFDFVLMWPVLPALICAAIFAISLILDPWHLEKFRKKLTASKQETAAAKADLENEKSTTARLRESLGAACPEWLEAAKVLPKDSQKQVLQILAKMPVKDLSRLCEEEAKLEASVAKFREVVRTANHENTITKALARRPWMLDAGLTHVPDTKILCFKSVETISSRYFQPSEVYGAKYFRQRDGRCMPDMVAWFDRTTVKTPEDSKPQRTLVIVESKNVPVDEVAVAQAIYYASNLCKYARPLREKVIECFVIGTSIEPGIKPQVHVFGATHELIKIIPMTWDGLIDQAKRMHPSVVTDMSHLVDDSADSSGQGDRQLTMDYVASSLSEVPSH